METWVGRVERDSTLTDLKEFEHFTLISDWRVNYSPVRERL